MTVKISGPAELISAVPYLLGFHPQESLVAIALKDGAVDFTARCDLADISFDPILDAARRAGAQSLVLFVYTSATVRPDGPLPYSGQVERLKERCQESDLKVSDALLLVADRYWSFLCENEDCCPPEGRPVPDDPGVAAEFIAEGLQVRPSRDDVRSALDPLPVSDWLAEWLPKAEDLVGGYAREEREAYEEDAGFVLGVLAYTQMPLRDQELLYAGVALRQIPIRDAAWAAVDRNRELTADGWLALGRRLPGVYACAPLLLFAWAAWREGNAMLAGAAVDRILELDPDYTAARLLQFALNTVIDPRSTPPLNFDDLDTGGEA